VKTTIFKIPRSGSIKQVEVFMKQNLNLQFQEPDVITRTYLDTFDWRIFSSGGVLESAVDEIGNWLTWRPLGAEQVHGRCPIDQIPGFVWDLRESDIKTKLEKILEFRALLPVATVATRIHVAYIHDDQGKIILRIEFQSDCPSKDGCVQKNQRNINIGKRVHLYPIKGNKGIMKEACLLLQKECHLDPLSDDPLVTTLKHFGKEPGRELQDITVSDPEQRADTAVKNIFYQLLQTMEDNENGIIEDIDSEFLHDFRVALRRTRSLLGQIRNVLPKRRGTRFKKDFAWLGEVTGPTRDMDVYMLSFNEYKKNLPTDAREDITPLYEFLQRHRHREHDRLVKVLNGVRYRKLKQDWEKFLKAPAPKYSTLKNASRPILNVASEHIWRAYRSAYKQGNIIVTDSPATLLHELRKTCKKLRYLNEFFQNLYPEKKMQKLIGNLKDLQDNLGEFQDLQVQQDSLQQFISDMENETGIVLETRKAIEMLVTRLAIRNQVVRSAFDVRFKKFSSISNFMLYKNIIASQRKLHSNIGHVSKIKPRLVKF
jgi:CHAD domain-containing protein